MILVLLVIVNLGLNGLIDWYTVCLVPLNPYQFFLAVQYPRIVVSTFNIVFYMYTLILEERFKLINLIIKQEEFFSPKIKRMVLLHKTLVRVAKSLNQVFAPQLLLWVLLGVMVVTVDLHVFFFTLFNKLLGQYPVGIVGVKNASLFIFDLIFLSFRCTKLCKEANKTAFLWYHIKIDREDEEARDDFIKLGIKLSNDKLEITACRLFKIDNSLILDLLVFITINFVVLLGDLYVTLYIILTNNQAKYCTTLIGLIKNCVIVIFELYYLSHVCQNVSTEVIGNILRLMHRRFEITALRLFTIDNKLLFGVLAYYSTTCDIATILDFWVRCVLSLHCAAVGGSANIMSGCSTSTSTNINTKLFWLY
uniref:Gustatory receptor n=1 Tax=Tribolium castaneum TaxID=7070 RepID=A2AXC2_TRICA|nr:gustatory receptor candidate 60 [Tribolium castaneum]